MNSRAVVAMVAIALVVAIGAMAGRIAIAAGPPTVNLRTATSFAVLAGAGIMNTGPSVINGDIGSFGSTTAITGFPPGTVNGTNHAGDGVTQGAKTDLVTAYDDAAGSGPPISVSANLGGQSLVAGVYNSASALSLTGPVPLTLSGGPSDVWIFQAGSTLITGTGSSVVLIGGAQSCNIFWQVGSSATIGVGSAFKGTIIALTSITVETGATIDGRVLARNGAVTLDTNNITKPTCAAPAPIPPTRPPFTVAPSATPILAPTATPIATAAPTATPIATAAPTATPIGTAASAVAPTAAAAPTASPAGAGVQVLPSTSTGEPFSPLLMLGIALAGIGILVLRRQIRHS